NASQAVIQSRQDGFGNGGRHPAVVRLSNRTRDARHRVGVSPQGDGVADGVLVPGRFQEGDNRLRDGPLARYFELVRRAQLIQGLIQEVVEPPLDVLADLLLGTAGTGEEDRGRGRLSTANALLMVVR